MTRNWSESSFARCGISGAGETIAEQVELDEADFVVLQDRMPVQVGKWRILPPGVEDDPQNRADNGE